ncbi:hypothetical protein LEL_06883 [Akanthomyces lecanii RCEF 1005]|uniref:Serine aminopeptidase S33 domain-containing protein n=1 Tax=Akanthomyces lecanii RCEF 1005 TaxID=1081108 RepID=A0A168FAL1_CORDF|nr:hypothetical protein LEL_06883 [Akanthomyces lecanii RCEF 1005]
MAASQKDVIASSWNRGYLAVTIYNPPWRALDENMPLHRPPAVVVMGHGLGAIQAAGLEPFAVTFSTQGFIAITFDYMCWGESEGQPRGLLSLSGQLQDWRGVLSWVRKQPQRFDVNRIVVWGSSLGGIHITSLLAEDHGLTGGIAQCPCVDGLKATLKVPLAMSLCLLGHALYDYFLSCLGLGPHYIATATDGSRETWPAVMEGDDTREGWKRTTPESVPFPNKIAARSIFSLMGNRPILKIHKSVKPYLIVLPEWDNQAPLDSAEEVVWRAPFGEDFRFRGGHFDLYYNGIAYEENIRAQLNFLERITSQ